MNFECKYKLTFVEITNFATKLKIVTKLYYHLACQRYSRLTNVSSNPSPTTP